MCTDRRRRAGRERFRTTLMDSSYRAENPLTALGLLGTIATRTGLTIDVLASRVVASEDGLDIAFVAADLVDAGLVGHRD
jgi:hypothetical protein